MYIQEAAERSGTTKKAIEYYCTKGLVSPQLSESGYRIFSEEDAVCLKKISLLRSLGVSVEEIRELLSGNDEGFQKIIEKQETAILRKKEQHDLLKELAASGDWDTVRLKAAAAETRQSVTDRLTAAFPGFWGQFLSLHFGRFLQEPVRTEEQEDALREIFEFLDGVRLEVPEEMKTMFEEMDSEAVRLEVPEEMKTMFEEMDSEAVRQVLRETDTALSAAVEDPETWMKDHQEIIDQYLAFQKTDEYRNSPGARLKELLTQFNQEQGYNRVFIPAMRRLSPAYDAWIIMLQKADQVFSDRYPGRSGTPDA